MFPSHPGCCAIMPLARDGLAIGCADTASVQLAIRKLLLFSRCVRCDAGAGVGGRIGQIIRCGLFSRSNRSIWTFGGTYELDRIKRKNELLEVVLMEVYCITCLKVASSQCCIVPLRVCC